MNSVSANSKEALQERFDQGRLSRTWPFLMVFTQYLLQKFIKNVFFCHKYQEASNG